MGAPESGMKATELPTAEALLTTLRTIKDGERVRHSNVLDYWLSIRGDQEFPPLHDLDPLEMSDAAPSSILLELIGGGQDAEIRHLGDALKDDVTVQRVIDAPNPSLLSSIARKLPIVAISREFLAYEENFSTADGLTRCWVTLLPLSSCGSWVDYVYAFVSLEKESAGAAPPGEPSDFAVEDAVAPESEAPSEELTIEPEASAEDDQPPAEELARVVPVATDEADPVEEAVADADEPAAATECPVEAVAEPEPEPAPEQDLAEDPTTAKGGPGFSKLLEGLSHLTGFYGQGVKVEDPVVAVDMPAMDPAAAELPPLETGSAEPAEAPLELNEVAAPAAVHPTPEPAATEDLLQSVEPAPAMEGKLQNKLTEVRAKADEARQAALRATTALHEGLSAAYDFALDAETCPEEYLRLVESEGLKIQLRAPMAPVAKLAFDGLVDVATLGQCEKILAWALKEELPRGELLARIEQAGGIFELVGELKAA